MTNVDRVRSASAEVEALRTYRGSCHCGAFAYEADLPEIRIVDECNCSICRTKGYIFIFPSSDAFRVVKGSVDNLTSYSYGSRTKHHKFCSYCATPLLVESADGAMEFKRALNVHALEGINTWELEKKPFNGAALGESWVPPAYKGNLPALSVGLDTMLYLGCHCGRVGLALVSKPLDETFGDLTRECNCSICERNACYWLYSKTDQVALAANDEDLGHYSFGPSWLMAKTFCRHCGICLSNLRCQDRPDSAPQLSKDDERVFGAWMNAHHTVNLRVIPEVDFARMKPAHRFDGANLIISEEFHKMRELGEQLLRESGWEVPEKN